MPELSDLIQHDDWKTEKHVPVIECPEKVKSGDMFEVKVTLGKEVDHPNTTEHHIAWISVYFKPNDEKNAIVVGNYEFSAHGQSTQGPNEGAVYTHHSVTTQMKTTKPGVLYAMAYCNIHGLWESTKNILIE